MQDLIQFCRTDRQREILESVIKHGGQRAAARGKFKGAWWCKTSPAKDRFGRPRGKGAWIPCDAYTLKDEYWHPDVRRALKAEYYLKMCKALDGTAVLFVSIHV